MYFCQLYSAHATVFSLIFTEKGRFIEFWAQFIECPLQIGKIGVYCL